MVEADELYQKILKALKDQTEDIKSDIKDINLQLLEATAAINGKLKKIEEEQTCIKQNLLELERLKRKNNIIIFGLNADENDLLLSVLNKLNDLLDIHLCESDINDIYKLNRKTDSPIKIELISFLKKKLIFGSVKKLKGKRVYINNDLCKEDREKQKILRTHLKLAQQKGYKAYIKNRKLIINNEAYTPEELEKHTLETNTQDSPEINEVQATSSAPSTPTPLARRKEVEKEIFTNGNEETPEIVTNKKNKTQIYSEKPLKKQGTILLQ